MLSYHAIPRRLRRFFPMLMALAVATAPVQARGGYGYHYGHGYHGYYPGFHARYSSRGGIGTAGAVVLGLLGVAVLARLLGYDHDDRPRRIARSAGLPAYPRAATRPPSYPRASRHAHEPLQTYGSNEGWEQLKAGNSERAMTVFAIQSQQNLQSGVPKIGFALAAAANSELERAVWSMHRALQQDPEALGRIPIDGELDKLISDLTLAYDRRAKKKTKPGYEAFMVAALAYLQRDYATAQSRILDATTSTGTDNLLRLITNGPR